MDIREQLFEDSFFGNELCKGCAILDKNKPIHSYIDHEKMDECDVLFLSDSLKYRNGNISAFSKDETKLISETLNAYSPEGIHYEYSASIKCPNVKERDMNKKDRDICRQHLIATVEKLKPKLIFACGNLALTMINKVGGLKTKDNVKRGADLPYKLSDHECTIVPLFHPFFVIQEPKNRFLFQSDIKNALGRHFGSVQESEFSYTPIMSYVELLPYQWLRNAKGMVIAADIETTGLNFKKDEICSVSLSYRMEDGIETIVIPIFHHETPFTDGELYNEVLPFLKGIMENPEIIKVFHHAPFDSKFFREIGIVPCNVRDTKIMHHLVLEDVPNSLMQLVNIYFPEEFRAINANSN